MAKNMGNSGCITCSIFTLATLHPMKSTEPTGGVQRPTQRFKTIETVFKNSECYIVKKGNTKSAGLVAGDRIITRGTELSDLKVMK